jgi:ABC-type transport system substrate-binding protein
MEAQRDEAIQILKEEGFDFDKTYLFTVESDAQVAARATFVQEQLRLLGIETDFDQVETVAYRQQEATGTWGDILPGNATMPTDDPALGMGYYFRCDSTANYWTPGTDCDQEMETLLDQALSEADPAKRREISDKIQLKAMREYWKFPLYWEQEAVSFWPEVRGYFHHPQPSGAHTDYEQMWIDPAHKDDTGNAGQTSGVPGGI